MGPISFFKKIRNQHRRNFYLRFSTKKSLNEASVFERSLLLQYHALEKNLYQKVPISKARTETLTKQLSYGIEKGFITSNSGVYRIGQDYLKMLSLNKTEHKGEFSVGIHVFEKTDFLSKNGNALLISRHSVRETSDAEIAPAILFSAFSAAAKAPSACDRQPCRIIYSLSNSGNQKIKNYVPDRPTIQKMKYALLVVCDRGLFSDAEDLQDYVNGGIFVYSLSLSLLSAGLVNCIFQCPLPTNASSAMRKDLGIREQENAIAFIGFGYPSDSIVVFNSPRLPIEDISRKID